MSYRTISVSSESKKLFDSAYYAAKSVHTGEVDLSMDTFVEKCFNPNAADKSFLAKLLKDMKKKC